MQTVLLGRLIDRVHVAFLVIPITTTYHMRVHFMEASGWWLVARGVLWFHSTVCIRKPPPSYPFLICEDRRSLTSNIFSTGGACLHRCITTTVIRRMILTFNPRARPPAYAFALSAAALSSYRRFCALPDLLFGKPDTFSCRAVIGVRTRFN